VDRRHFDELNFWRDYLPGQLEMQLEQSESGTECRGSFPAGELVAPHDSSLHRKIKREHILRSLVPGQDDSPLG
jgi:hypothetical protein